MDHLGADTYTDRRFSVRTSTIDMAASKADRVSLKIGDLTIDGFSSQESLVANFRNIQYARIAARWHEAKPTDPTRDSGVLDATQWGPRSPQPIDVLHDATRHLYPRMSTFDRQSEFECLNLNVYGPTDVVGRTQSGRRLPVLVWIHGGAFVYGDGGCEFDGQYLVRRSIELGEPILVVGFNYRLGVLGFLASKELREETRLRGESGFNNLGLHDQRVALQWIQKNIHHFGGDGSRITVSGESAGAISILCHLRGQVPLFENAFIMSPAMLQPLPVEQVQKSYDQIVDKLGLSDAPVGQQLSALRSISPHDLHNFLSLGVGNLCEDPAFFSDYGDEKWEEIAPFPSWCHRIVVGQTRDETVLFSQQWAATSAEDLYREWMALYSEDTSYAQEVLSAYGITERSPQENLVAAYVAHTGDVMFSRAVNGIALSHLRVPSNPADPKVYLYLFCQPDVISRNPVFRNRAYHSQDNAFLFYFPQVTGPDAPVEFKATAEAFSGAALDVICGREPFEDVSVARRYMSFNGDKTGLQEREEASVHRWEQLADTEERLAMFMRCRGLLFKAMDYATTLLVGTRRRNTIP